jgi:hypothetical protein
VQSIAHQKFLGGEFIGNMHQSQLKKKRGNPENYNIYKIFPLNLY